jgi:glycosyltransferase involved in cell wall biosynthesis
VKVAVVAPGPVPPTFGGNERAVAGVVREINARTGHSAEQIDPPVDERTLIGLLEGYRVFAAMDLNRFDLVISMKYPSWAIEHPAHTTFLPHTLRGLYDTYDVFHLPRNASPREPELQQIVADAEQLWLAALDDPRPRGDLLARRDTLLDTVTTAVDRVGAEHPDLALPSPLARTVVRALDAVSLAPGAVRRYLANARTTANRPDYFPPGVRPGVVYLPPDVPGIRQGGRRHLFTASRLDQTKRVALIVEAMRHTEADIPLLVAGRGPEAEHLRWLADGDERIRFLGFVEDDEMAGYYADALAVPFVPLYEDYGLITVEAMACGTPVITTPDAGGPTEFVDHWVTGIVATATPESIGAAFDILAADDELAAELGRNALAKVADLTWDATIDQLLEVRPARPVRALPFQADVPVRERTKRRGPLDGARRDGFGLVVVLSTYPVHPATFGGPLRCSRLLAGVAQHHDLHVICLGAFGEAQRDQVVAQGVRQTVVPLTRDHAEGIWAREGEIGVPLGDICGGLAIDQTPTFLELLAASLRGADAVVLEHPYLLPALDHVGSRVPLVLDEHNVEWDLKHEAYPHAPDGRRLAAAVAELEIRATLEADAVVAVSEADAERLAGLTGRAAADMAIIPNGTDLHHHVPSAATRASARDRWLARFLAAGRHGSGRGARQSEPRPTRLALFLGSWHPPNLDAAEVVFTAARHLPEVLFLHGGSHALALRGRPLPANIVLLGSVSERVKDTLLATVDVALNPMRQGSGTNLKLLEYLAAGVPVVSSSFGARGLVDGGERFVHPGEPAALATSIEAVLAEPAKAHALALAGRSYVEAHYGWADLASRFGAVVSSVASADVRQI